MMGRKDKVVTTLTRGVEFLFRKNKVDWLKGKATIAAPERLVVTGGDGAVQEVGARSIIIATGSESTPLPGVDIDERRIVSSTGALSLDRVPERLAVIGGGYIGLELGSVWQRLGAKVTVVELLDHIVPNMDRELGDGVAAHAHPIGAGIQARHQARGHQRSGRRAEPRTRRGGTRRRSPPMSCWCRSAGVLTRKGSASKRLVSRATSKAASSWMTDLQRTFRAFTQSGT